MRARCRQPAAAAFFIFVLCEAAHFAAASEKNEFFFLQDPRAIKQTNKRQTANVKQKTLENNGLVWETMAEVIDLNANPICENMCAKVVYGFALSEHYRLHPKMLEYKHNVVAGIQCAALDFYQSGDIGSSVYGFEVKFNDTLGSAEQCKSDKDEFGKKRKVLLELRNLVLDFLKENQNKPDYDPKRIFHCKSLTYPALESAQQGDFSKLAPLKYYLAMGGGHDGGNFRAILDPKPRKQRQLNAYKKKDKLTGEEATAASADATATATAADVVVPPSCSVLKTEAEPETTTAAAAAVTESVSVSAPTAGTEAAAPEPEPEPEVEVVSMVEATPEVEEVAVPCAAATTSEMKKVDNNAVPVVTHKRKRVLFAENEDDINYANDEIHDYMEAWFQQQRQQQQPTSEKKIAEMDVARKPAANQQQSAAGAGLKRKRMPLQPAVLTRAKAHRV